MASSLRYADFQDELSLRDYKAHVRVVLADLWGRGELSDREICDEVHLTAIELERMRKSLIFDRLKEAVIREFQETIQVRTYADHIARPRVQDRLFRRRLQIALNADPKTLEIAEKAGKTLEEKILPKDPGKGGPNVILISSEDIRLLRDTSTLMRQIGSGPGHGEPATDHEGLPGGGETPS